MVATLEDHSPVRGRSVNSLAVAGGSAGKLKAR